MALPRLVVSLLVLCALCSSCVNDEDPNAPLVDPPVDPGSDSSDIRLISISQDTLFWNEPFSITFEGKIAESDAAQIFVHSVETPIDSIVGNTLFARVVENTESGSIRLYKRGLLARGDLDVVVIPISAENAFGQATYFTPNEGPTGTVISIQTWNRPIHLEHCRATIGGTPLIPRGFTETMLEFEIPANTQDGMLALHLRQIRKELGEFNITSTNDAFLEDRAVKEVEVSIELPTRTLLQVSDNETRAFIRTFRSTFVQVYSSLAAEVDDKDTVRYAYESVIGNGDTTYVKFVLQSFRGTRKVSGVIEMLKNDGSFGSQSRESMRLTIENAEWVDQGNQFVIEARGTDVTNVLTDLDWSYSHPDQGSGPWMEWLVDHGPATDLSSLRIVFKY